MTPAVRPGRENDLPALVDIYNHGVVHTPITFDTEPFTVEGRRAWFARFSASGPQRLLVAESGGEVVEVGPDACEAALSRNHAREMGFTGRPMRDFVYVDPPGYRTACGLNSRVDPGLLFARSMPKERGGGES